ncbi:uncharacterized protein M421DRAFT_60345 [Didymella exigua CBS 183.55]|uniref:Zn(2)-C6 fungal-type domain-containing protein n=1 Tax=Didymella exigua CBS 183.55 TaxID=1150837 RepID=A0A6A5RQC4_9PLEO|nr:uncharacterized protein M421DRAFT_60345 [Didymella exigua CBS 183.55]KAF1929633.1 hypothetical protein M421DRAFT_60345 [Didymella exigua CBS 183.55]
MPRPKVPGVVPKKRSRYGCWPCKARKVKCGEEKPNCLNCEHQGEPCDYSIRLNWGGRTKREPMNLGSGASSTASDSPFIPTFSFGDDALPWYPPTSEASAPPNNANRHGLSSSQNSTPRPSPTVVDPELARIGRSGSHQFGSNLTYQQGQFTQSVNGLPASAPFLQSQFQTQFEFPPSGPVLDEFAYSNVGFTSVNAEAPLSPPSMPPPRGSGDLMYKRHKSSHSADSPTTALSEAYSPNPGPPTPYSPFVTMPLTPNSSVGSEDPSARSSASHQSPAYPPSDLRRLSVQSLVNNTHGSTFQEYSQDDEARRRYPVTDSESTIYGYDLGLPDWDTPRNKDDSAIAVFSPEMGTRALYSDLRVDDAEPRARDMAFGKGGYYAKPVQIRIPKSLEPLPPILMENMMNLLYFHHFINHTARILVPHDCEKNPFRQILPEMAVRDASIMNLLLAYSASHRARMLAQSEPSNRIAVWVQDVFPKLRQSLASNPREIPNSTLAAVIMMASLEIIASNTFEVPISWQSHLQMARAMVLARGGPQGVDRADRVSYFLSRWFAYLDVLGSLSGSRTDTPLGSMYWSRFDAAHDEELEIDCLMGFTNRCVGSLARVSELARACEPLRIDCQGNIREDWHPTPAIYEQALAIKAELEAGLGERHVQHCTHSASSSSASEQQPAWDATEIYATNAMFHWGGLVHLYRRVLGKRAADPAVQGAIREIVELLSKVRRGSSAEACLLFPMFVAGCNAQDPRQREKIMDRLRGVEAFGMTQIDRARSLMQRVWETAKPWESLVSGEFFG